MVESKHLHGIPVQTSTSVQREVTAVLQASIALIPKEATPALPVIVPRAPHVTLEQASARPAIPA